MKAFKRILVGLKEKDHAAELAELACRLAARGARLWLVHVVDLPAATPLDAEVPGLDAQTKAIVGAAARVVRRHRLKPSPLVLRARFAGQALVEELKEKRIELAVVGYHRKRTLEEILLGTTHQYLARHAPCRLLVSIAPAA